MNMQTYKLAYRIDGQLFGFNVCRISAGNHEIRCTSLPANPWGTGVHVTHVYGSGKLCIEARITTLDAAKAWCQFWAAGYTRYIRTGDSDSFRKIPRKVDI